MFRTLVAAAITLSLAPLAHAGQQADLAAEFYRAVGHGDVNTVMRLLHPETRKLVDRPVVQAWVLAAAERLGPYVSSKVASKEWTVNLTTRRVDTESQVTFRQGTATASLGVAGGKIVSFNVISSEMAGWFQGLQEIDPYEHAAEAFITAFLSRQESKAHRLMHPALREVAPAEKLSAMIAQVGDNSGELLASRRTGQRFVVEEAGPKLFLTYEIECERAQGECEIEFQFIGMKGHLLGFNFR